MTAAKQSAHRWAAEHTQGMTTALRASHDDLLAALREITDHFAAVAGGPMLRDRVKWENGVEGIPTIKAARTAIVRAEGQS